LTVVSVPSVSWHVPGTVVGGVVVGMLVWYVGAVVGGMVVGGAVVGMLVWYVGAVVGGMVVGGAVVGMLVWYVVGVIVVVVEYAHLPSLHEYPCGQDRVSMSGELALIPLQ
jgi:hypothetical protein